MWQRPPSVIILLAPLFRVRAFIYFQNVRNGTHWVLPSIKKIYGCFWKKWFHLLLGYLWHISLSLFGYFTFLKKFLSIISPFCWGIIAFFIILWGYYQFFHLLQGYLCIISHFSPYFSRRWKQEQRKADSGFSYLSKATAAAATANYRIGMCGDRIRWPQSDTLTQNVYAVSREKFAK